MVIAGDVGLAYTYWGGKVVSTDQVCRKLTKSVKRPLRKGGRVKGGWRAQECGAWLLFFSLNKTPKGD